MAFTWLILFVVLIFLELITVNLVTIWFAIGALVSFFVSLFNDNSSLQIGIFVVVSFISLILTKKVVEKLKDKKVVPTNLDRVIGQVGVVTEEIKPSCVGEVKVDGKRWSAVSNETIEINSKVKILAINGVKLECQKIEEKN